MTLFGGVCMQAGTNFINTYGDYVAGVDTIETAAKHPQLVAGMLTPDSVKRAGIVAFALGSAAGLILTYLCGWEVLVFGIIGLIGGYCYTAGVSPYKYCGLGPIFVFFLMGPLMTWPAYFIQTGTYSLLPVLTSLPVGFLVTGILHANDIRDIAADKKAGIKTIALSIGLYKSAMMYYSLYAAAYVCLLILVIEQMLPWTALLPLVLVPMVISLFSRIQQIVGNEAYEQFSRLEADSAGLHFQFGVLLLLGILISPYVNGRWL